MSLGMHRDKCSACGATEGALVEYPQFAACGQCVESMVRVLDAAGCYDETRVRTGGPFRGASVLDESDAPCGCDGDVIMWEWDVDPLDFTLMECADCGATWTRNIDGS